ncbi:hypothetical protein HWV62_9557 [Athelia sp. TMB]|nr:hypothetical protein HWV62_9557 [Athelia sp. TMB]
MHAPSTPENRSRRSAQTFTPGWPEGADSSPVRATSSASSSTPSAPRISSVALPSAPGTTPPRSGHLPTPPSSPEASTTSSLGLIQLSPVLIYNHQRPQALWHVPSGQAPGGSPVPRYLQQSAFDFGVAQGSLTVRVRIYGSTTKWTLQIRASSSAGVTVYDVLNQLVAMLHSPVSNAENGAYGAEATQAATRSFYARAGVDPTAMQTGLKRLDFLGGRVIIAGLAPARDNSSWDVYFL